jgi:enamine deaminase RidA (YjgF/YER057c/UK114 family)
VSIEYRTIPAGAAPVETRYSLFRAGTGDGEYHVAFIPPPGIADAARAVALLDDATRAFPAFSGHPDAVPAWRRFFLGDVVNRRQAVSPGWPAAESFTGQPPATGLPAIAWAYYVDRAWVTRDGDTTIMHRGSLEHHFYTGLHDTSAPDEASQTTALFRALHDEATARGTRFADEMTRSWIYINDIDNRYAGMVAARAAFFSEVGLTAATHYIASTGIEGKSHHRGCLVHADVTAMKGLAPGQVTYLRGGDHLGRADRYGVTFERATVIAHGDRVRLLVSGTASIDRRGALLFPLDATAQARRAMQNIEALLHEGGATPADITHAIVYLRDAPDHAVVAPLVTASWPGVPAIYLVAAVCRPGWLVEIECSALVARPAPFPAF